MLRFTLEVGLVNFALEPHCINGHDRAFERQQFQQFREMAVISLDLSLTLRCPRTSF